MQPPRIAERRDEQERLDLAAGDLDQALAEVDLKLLARRCSDIKTPVDNDWRGVNSSCRQVVNSSCRLIQLRLF